MPPIESEQDIVLVQNIDVNCDEIDAETGVPHSRYFEVRWDKNPYRVAPGESRPLPRYIADHFAKHLCDHIMMRRAAEIGSPSALLNDKKLRAEITTKIVLGTESYLHADGLSDNEPADQFMSVDTAPVVETGLREPASLDELSGIVSPKLVVDDGETVIKKKAPTQSQLLKEARALFPEREFTGRETRVELIDLIKTM